MLKRSGFSWPFFLFGLGINFQLVASLSMTELFILVAAPLLFASEYPYMKRNGVHVFFWLSFLVFVGCALNYFIFGATSYIALRRFAQVSVFVCAVVVIHRMLRQNTSGFKWILVGAAISMVACTFVFKKSVEITTSRGDMDRLINGPLFWIQRVKGFAMLPATGWYLQTSTIYSAIVPFMFAAFCMVVSSSGRSAALVSIAFAAMAIAGGKSVRKIKRVGKNFLLLLLLAIMMLPVVNLIYRTLALNGTLGEEAQKKYIGQTRGGAGIISLIIGGRSDSISGLYACLHSPILGFGLMGEDPHGYCEEFLDKYGAPEDIEARYQAKLDALKYGYDLSEAFIATHSNVAAFWTYYGVFGLIYWIYVLFVFFRHIKQDAWAVPQWYGWLACSIPSILWNIFFSPVSDRVTIPLVVVACLITRAVRKGRQPLQLSMIREIKKHMK